MKTDIKQLINSGILEAYVTGAANPDEELEVEYLRRKHPEVNNALTQLELDLEHMASAMAIEPPPHVWSKIEQEIDGLILKEKTEPDFFKQPDTKKTTDRSNTGPQYIEVEAQNSYMRVHKSWKWILTAIFILGKIFLVCAIFFYLENRQAQQQIQELKSEIKVLKK